MDLQKAIPLNRAYWLAVGLVVLTCTLTIIENWR